MAFNFNWSPLIADTSRAREMLTAALNKSPKPPIIVDDIIVNELNLGSTPPELEILEIGDLAEDRFRGIFKMSYAGDAFLTLKTKVQANPMNTYLSGKPSFASPEPLAAASGLTIPLQITLSDIRLSGFVILVFSRQKGLTLVFRNDPLESLKVSSTFDTIPFVRDYLQKEIEGQLRILFMEDLPAIIHRLSLRLWSTEYHESEPSVGQESSKDAIKPVDPLATPPHDAVDAFGNPLDESQLADLADDPTEAHASFSQKNILGLMTLVHCGRTLSLFTPPLPEAVYRARANLERQESGANTPPLTVSSLSRIQSTFGNSRSHSSSIASGSTGNETQSTRPSLASHPSTQAGLSNRSRMHPQRKRKHRVVNLRKDKETDETSGVSTGVSTATVSGASSVIPEEPEVDDVQTPPDSPRSASSDIPAEPATPQAPASQITPQPSQSRPKLRGHASSPSWSENPMSPLQARLQNTSPLLRSLSYDKVSAFSTAGPKPLFSPDEQNESSTSGGILEQAWMMKMAQEIARKVQHEKEREARGEEPKRGSAGGLWDTEPEGEAPPAYTA